MFELSVKTHFSAAHRLVGHEGDCADLHGHNWDVEIFIRGENLNDIGILMDFREVKDAVKSALSEIDHKDLNKLPAFGSNNPTSENIARFLYERLSGAVNCDTCAIHKVTVYETPGSGMSYWEEKPVV